MSNREGTQGSDRGPQREIRQGKRDLAKEHQLRETLPTQAKRQLEISMATSEAWRRLEEVVSIPTQSAITPDAADSNIEYINNVHAYFLQRLKALGVPEDQFHITEIVNPSPRENPKPQKTLLVRIGTNSPGGIMFCGHSDVVSTVGQEDGWNTSPYVAEIKTVEGEKRMYGRGTVDMKGGNEAAIQALLRAAKSREKLEKPVYLAITHSEELGPGLSKGDFQSAINKMQDETGCVVAPEAVIVAEPTDSEMLFAHKGGTGFIIHIDGKDKTDAFDYACSYADKLLEAQSQLMKNKDMQDAIFHPPYAIINVGMITFDLVSNQANIEVHTRLTSKVGFEEIRGLMDKAVEDVKSEMENASAAQVNEKNISCIKSYTVKFKGMGGHSAYPEKGISTIATICSVMKDVQAIRRENPDVEIHVVHASAIGNAGNAIPGSGNIGITLQGSQDRIEQTWREISEKLDAAVQVMHKERNAKNSKLRARGEDLIPEAEALGITSQEMKPLIPPPEDSSRRHMADVKISHGGILEAPLLPRSDKTGIHKIKNAIDGALEKITTTGTASYVTDAGFVSEILSDATVVVFGPGRTFEQGAHGVNEYIERRQMQQAVQGNFGLIDSFCHKRSLD